MVLYLFIMILLILCGTVFVYTPGDIAATQLFGFGGTPGEASTWIIYGVIFVYYLIATILPIDKIIGKIYPILGGILILSALGIFAMLFAGGYQLAEIFGDWTLGGFDFGAYFQSHHFIPSFFVTVACGILSGFHSTQTSLIARTMESERHGRMTFYNMMICEGFIAMIWTAGAMAVIGLGAKNSGITMQLTETGWGYFESVDGALRQISPTSVVGVICRNMLGDIGGMIAIIGVIILPITTGDTALRSLRLVTAETFHIKQKNAVQRILLAAPIFTATLALLIWAKNDPNGFNVIWKYMGWANQTVSIFATSSIMIYMMHHGKTKYVWMPAIPLLFYSFVTTSYLLSAPEGFSLDITLSYIISGVFTGFIFAAAIYRGSRKTFQIRENSICL